MVNAMIPLSNLDQVFNTFFTGNRCAAPRSQGETVLRPRANIFEGDSEYRILLDLPGVQKSDLEIELESEMLTVQAKRSSVAPEGFEQRRSEQPAELTLRRSFRIGKEIDVDGIRAELSDGVLTLSLRKAEQALPRRIEIK